MKAESAKTGAIWLLGGFWAPDLGRKGFQSVSGHFDAALLGGKNEHFAWEVLKKSALLA